MKYRYCAHEYEKSKDMASAALAYKCVELAFMRVIYSSHNTASRDRHELQTVLEMIPPGNILLLVTTLFDFCFLLFLIIPSFIFSERPSSCNKEMPRHIFMLATLFCVNPLSVGFSESPFSVVCLEERRKKW